MPFVPPDAGISAEWKQEFYSEYPWGLLGLRFCLLHGKSSDDTSVRGWLKLSWENIYCSPCPETRVLVTVLVQTLLCRGQPGDMTVDALGVWHWEKRSQVLYLVPMQLVVLCHSRIAFSFSLLIPLKNNKDGVKTQVNPRNDNFCSFRQLSMEEKRLE